MSPPRDSQPETPAEGRARKPWLIGGGVLGLLVIGFLAFGVFGVHTLFIDEKVDEEGFEFASGAVAPDDGAAPSTPSTEPEATEPAPAPSTAPAPVDSGPEAEAVPEAEVPETTAPPTTPPPPPPTEPAIRLVARGGFSPENHSGRGTTHIYTDGNQAVVRFEDDFATENGPDLYAVVYVGGERIELGQLKGNQGSQNYEIPADVDPEAIEAVSVWCKRFDSTFTTATVA